MAKVKIVEYIGEGSPLVVSREIHFDEFIDFLQYELRDEPTSPHDVKYADDKPPVGVWRMNFGKQPVDDNVLVEVRLVDGGVGIAKANSWVWGGGFGSGNIVEYRVVNEN